MSDIGSIKEVLKGLSGDSSKSYSRREPWTPETMPYNHLVPRTLVENLKFREAVLKLGRTSDSAAHDIWCMCSRDPLFWVNTFGWTYDPRLVNPRVPFMLFDFQQSALLQLVSATGIAPKMKAHDLCIEKSRDTGATWLCILATLFGWHFRDMMTYLWVSRKEDIVDKTDDPDAMMWKADFILDNEPAWLRPRMSNKDRMKLLIGNPETQSIISGESSNSDLGVGGRRTACVFDEFARIPEGQRVWDSTRDVTNCRIANSTPMGTNAFYRLHQNPAVQKVTLHWSRDPRKNSGLYVGKDGRPRSPWYDNECEIRSRLDVAQNLDIDFQGSGGAFFDLGELAALEAEFSILPTSQGELTWDKENPGKLVYTEQEGGALLVWMPIATGAAPPPGRKYVVAVDTSTGTGASNSVISVGDLQTREKVAEYAVSDRRGRAENLAKMCVRIATWFNHALVIWEDNGPGSSFGNNLTDLGWGFVWFERNEKGNVKRARPGWSPTQDGKRDMLTELRNAWASKKFAERSSMCIEEARSYVDTGGSVAFGPSLHTDDPTGAKKNHGDRVITSALLWRVMQENTPRPAEEIKGEQGYPLNSVASRRKAWREKQRQTNWW